MSLTVDYGAPLSEAGDVTAKYLALRDLLKDVAADSIRKDGVIVLTLYLAVSCNDS